MNHQNLLKLQTIYQDRDYFYLAFEYLDGHLLSEHIEGYGPLSTQECAIVLEVLLEIINYLSKNGIIHRNITPAHILIKSKVISRENIFLVGFGNSASTKKSFIIPFSGTPGYIAPEIFLLPSFHLDDRKKSQIRPQCDYFSLGITFYVMLFGSLPYENNVFEKNKKMSFKFIKCEKFDVIRKDILSFLDINQKTRRCADDELQISALLRNLMLFFDSDHEEGNINFLCKNLEDLQKYKYNFL